MYCKKCGQLNEDESLFCSGCGRPMSSEKTTNTVDEQGQSVSGQTESLAGLPVPGSTPPAAPLGTFEQQVFSKSPPNMPAQYNDMPEAPEPALKRKEKKKSTLPLILTIVLVLVLGGAAATVFGVSALDTKKYDELIDTGNKYLEELKYEEAVETFIEAIDIKPKREEAYVGAATGYVKLDKPEKAKEILEKGLKNVKKPGDEFKDLCDELGVEYDGSGESETTIILPEKESANELSDNSPYSGFLSKSPFDDNKSIFTKTSTFDFNTYTASKDFYTDTASRGIILPNWPQGIADIFYITGDFDRDGNQDIIRSNSFSVADTTVYGLSIQTKALINNIGFFKYSNSDRNYDVHCYLSKGSLEDYFVNESITKVAPVTGKLYPVGLHDDKYELYETISVYGIKSQKTIMFEYFYSHITGECSYTHKEISKDNSIEKCLYFEGNGSSTKEQLYKAEGEALSFIKKTLAEYCLSERVHGNGAFSNEHTSLCSIRTTMNPDYWNREDTSQVFNGIITIYSNEITSSDQKPNTNETSQDGFAGNQTVEQLRKSIVGKWVMYEFTADGKCYYLGDYNSPGTYKIENDKTLLINFPWTKNSYEWSNKSFEEFHKDSRGYYWYLSDDDILTLNGSNLYRGG